MKSIWNHICITSHEICVIYVRIYCELRMNFVWISYELLMNFIWNAINFIDVKFIRSSYELHVEFKWTSHEFHMKLNQIYWYEFTCSSYEIHVQQNWWNQIFDNIHGGPDVVQPFPLQFSLICAWIYAWIKNREAGNLRRHRAHYDVIVMTVCSISNTPRPWVSIYLWNIREWQCPERLNIREWKWLEKEIR